MGQLLIGDWGADTWCDLNRSGYSPVFPAAPSPKPASAGGGGYGGLVCVALNGTSGPGNALLGARTHRCLHTPLLAMHMFAGVADCLDLS